MNVIKRDGRVVSFDTNRIYEAIMKSFKELYGDNEEKMAQGHICACRISEEIETMNKKELKVEEIQDIVEKKLMASSHKDVAKAYINYRYLHDLIRQSNTTDISIKELISGESTYWNEENSNKNARIVTTQRDYLAGITSTDIAERLLLPKEVVKAHKSGILHFHDMDYFAQKSLHNCELVNLDDVLQNGTVVNGVMIEKPHRLITAATIATQVITAVTSSSYGGCTITTAHLAPFVRDSFNIYLKKYLDWGFDKEQAIEFAKKDTRKEIQDAVQTFNYQVNSMTNTNGQAPFLSVCLWVNENMEYQKENAILIEEFLRQRTLGFKNEKGVYITPAFPKLLYVLDENNASEGSEFWNLTVMAAKCSAKRLVPDYISAKIMKQNKIDKDGNGNVYPCMGCRSFLTPYVDPETGKPKYYGRLTA